MVSKTPVAVTSSNYCVDDDSLTRKEHQQQHFEKPLFIPPRKRQASKKTSGVQNYVDHIVQNRQKLSPSNAAAGLEDDLVKTSLILKNKQPLPALPTDVTCIGGNDNACHQQQEKMLASTQANIGSGGAGGGGYINDGDNEMTHSHSGKSGGVGVGGGHRYESSTMTPSSYSESSLDVKLVNCLSHRSSSKKRVNIRTDDITPHSHRNSPEIANYEVDLETGETSVLNVDDAMLDDHQQQRYQTRRSPYDRSCNYNNTINDSGHTSTNNYLTLTGTIKRGRKKGECMDFQINMSREELERINAAAVDVKKYHNLCCKCSWTSGVHIFLLSMLCLPFVMIISGIYSFYIGTITWYNMFNFFSEEKSCVHRLIMSPILILAYPVVIILCTVGLGLYAGIAQLSLQFYTWLNEIADIEKGFYGWLCSFLHLPDCSPYEVVVILTDIRMPPHESPPQLHVHTSTEELSL